MNKKRLGEKGAEGTEAYRKQVFPRGQAALRRELGQTNCKIGPNSSLLTTIPLQCDCSSSQHKGEFVHLSCGSSWPDDLLWSTQCGRHEYRSSSPGLRKQCALFTLWGCCLASRRQAQASVGQWPQQLTAGTGASPAKTTSARSGLAESPG